jgi:hypothetical protein
VEPLAPGGNEWSRDADGMKGMDEYIHLCFRPTHPMEFRAREERRIEQTIFLHIAPAVLQFDGPSFWKNRANAIVEEDGVRSKALVRGNHV